MTKVRHENRAVRRTRKRLQTAMIALLREKPLAKIQIKEIVHRADVSRPTFYNHFDTKEDLLFSHVDDLFEEIQHVVFARVEAHKTVDLQTLLISSYRQWLHHSEALQWVMQVDNKDLLIALLRTHIENLVQEYEKYVPPVELSMIDREYLLSFISGGTYMLLKDWLNNGMQESAEIMGTLTCKLLPNEFTNMPMNGLS